MRMNVDEAGSNHLTTHIHCADGRFVTAPYVRYPARLDCDVRLPSRPARSIDNKPAAQQQIDGHAPILPFEVFSRMLPPQTDSESSDRNLNFIFMAPVR
jgi:hypothetical protein